MQLVQHGQFERGEDVLIEGDVDRANPAYDGFRLVCHGLLDVLHLGRSNPFTVRAVLMKRGLFVPLAPEA